MKQLLAAALAACAMAAWSAPSFAATIEQDREKIQNVVETFRVSLIQKDPETFMKLFLKSDIAWIGVVTDKSLARDIASKRDPNMPDPSKLFIGDNPKDFIDRISKNKVAIEETFDNVRIDTDGDVAQVWFDYAFVKASYKQNWGKESWHLVNTKDGWKISSVIWSMEFNPVPPPKQK